MEKYELISGKETTKIFYVMSFPQSRREFLITGLKPLSNYTGKIIAELSDGRRGSTHWIGFRTKEGGKFELFLTSSSHFEALILLFACILSISRSQSHSRHSISDGIRTKSSPLFIGNHTCKFNLDIISASGFF